MSGTVQVKITTTDGTEGFITVDEWDMTTCDVCGDDYFLHTWMVIDLALCVIDCDRSE